MQNGPKLPKRLPVTLLLVSFIVGILALAAFAALLPAERFSNNGSVSGAPDGLVEPGGTRHNSYAWCMETMENTIGNEYLYVGSNRDLMWLIMSQSGLSNDAINGISDGAVSTSDGDLRGRIFRKRTDGTGNWEQIYISETMTIRSQDIPMDIGYRGVVSYATSMDTAPSLYFGTMGIVTTRVLRIGPDFASGDTPVTVYQTAVGSTASMRSLAVYDGGDGEKLYVGGMNPSNNPASADLQILESGNPALGNWKQIAFLDDFPGARSDPNVVKYGGVWDMIAFNGWLYAFIGSNYTGEADDGFLVFKGRPAQGGESANTAGWHWVPVVATGQAGAKHPNGVGNPSNVTASPFLYSVNGKDYVYVGTFADVITPVEMTAEGAETEEVLGSLYPCQVYRFDANDNWEMVIGNPEDSNGRFSSRIGNYGAGFFNAPSIPGALPEGIGSPRELSLNQYAWRMGVYKDKLYVTTFDAGVVLDFARNFADTPEEQLAMDALVTAFRTYNSNPAGFDLYVTEDGATFASVTTNGFDDKYNYGGRTVKATEDALFVGTANPFYGCQVWKLVEEAVPPGDDDDDDDDDGNGGGGGGGGCMGVGLAPYALLLILPMIVLRKR